MRVNIKEGFGADGAAVLAPDLMGHAGGIAASVDIHFVRGESIDEQISVGSKVIFLTAHH